MSEAKPPSAHDLLRLSAQIVSASVAKNAVPSEALPGLIRSVHAALVSVGQLVTTEPERPQPAVPIKRSVFADHLVSLEDAAKMVLLKRYLKVRFNLTPEQYRERWGLPRDYPMVAPDYAKRRSAIAIQSGLGLKAEPAPTLAPVPPPKKKGRPAKVPAEQGS